MTESERRMLATRTAKPKPMPPAVDFAGTATNRAPANPVVHAMFEAEQAEAELRQTEARRESMLKRLADELGPRYSAQVVEKFSVYHPEQKAVVKRVDHIAGDITTHIASGRCIVFFGPVGTGKDHLMARLLYAAARQFKRCRWVNSMDLYGGWRDAIDSGASEQKMLESFVEPNVLAISDPIPPAGTPTAWNVGQLFRIVDRRYRRMKPIWLTMNAIDDNDAEAMLSAPVFDRIRHDAEMIRCFWPSYRRRVGA